MKMNFLLVTRGLLCAGFALASVNMHAQSSDDQDHDNFDQIEAEIGKGAPKNSDDADRRRQKDNQKQLDLDSLGKSNSSGSSSGSSYGGSSGADAGAGGQNGADGSDAAPTGPELKKVSDLNSLAPFSEVSIIQRKFMPKTGRFQAFLGGSFLTNDPWYYGIGVGGRLGYHFSESWGVEANGMYLSSSEKQSAKDLRSNDGVSTDSLVTPKSYLGADLIWSPIYGKMSLTNRKIVHFDMYFAGGYGQTTINGSDKNSANTYHLGTGQIFAITKSVGFRWDFSWNYFTATQFDKISGASSSGNFSNLLLTLGVSFLFPEATYR